MNDDAYTHLDVADVAPDIDGTTVLERAKARGEAIRQKEGFTGSPPDNRRLSGILSIFRRDRTVTDA
jgi:hypothetical protein